MGLTVNYRNKKGRGGGRGHTIIIMPSFFGKDTRRYADACEGEDARAKLLKRTLMREGREGEKCDGSKCAIFAYFLRELV